MAKIGGINFGDVSSNLLANDMNQPLVSRISVPNPFFEGRNGVYLIALDPLTLIDTGVATDKAFGALQSGLGEHGVGIQDIRQVVLTHKHVDHIGNAWRIQQQSGAKIFIHETECSAVTNVDPGGQRFMSLVSKRLREWNAPSQHDLVMKANTISPWAMESAEATPLEDGQQIELEYGHLEVVHTPGHTLGSICLRFGDILFSGDHVLEEISPNVGGGDLRQTGMLARFLTSIERVRNLEGVTQVMPGHGESFATLQHRCRELVAHHDERLEETLSILRDRPRTVYEVAHHLFSEMKDFHLVLGCAEANAHLELLVDRGFVAHDDGKYFVP